MSKNIAAFFLIEGLTLCFINSNWFRVFFTALSNRFFSWGTLLFFIYSSALTKSVRLLEVYRHFRTHYFENIDDFYLKFFEISFPIPIVWDPWPGNTARIVILLFPFKNQGHYTELGYKLVAQTIIKKIYQLEKN